VADTLNRLSHHLDGIGDRCAALFESPNPEDNEKAEDVYYEIMLRLRQPAGDQSYLIAREACELCYGLYALADDWIGPRDVIDGFNARADTVLAALVENVTKETEYLKDQLGKDIVIPSLYVLSHLSLKLFEHGRYEIACRLNQRMEEVLSIGRTKKELESAGRYWDRRHLPDNKSIFPYDSEFHENIIGKDNGRIRTFGTEHLQGIVWTKKSRWLNIGGGKSVPLKRLAENIGFKGIIQVIDISQTAVEKARREGLRARVGDAQNLDVEDNSIDNVFMSFVVEYTQKPEKVFREIRRVLKPGCVAIIRIHHPYSGIISGMREMYEGLSKSDNVAQDEKAVIKTLLDNIDQYSAKWADLIRTAGLECLKPEEVEFGDGSPAFIGFVVRKPPDAGILLPENLKPLIVDQAVSTTRKYDPKDKKGLYLVDDADNVIARGEAGKQAGKNSDLSALAAGIDRLLSAELANGNEVSRLKYVKLRSVEVAGFFMPYAGRIKQDPGFLRDALLGEQFLKTGHIPWSYSLRSEDARMLAESIEPALARNASKDGSAKIVYTSIGVGGGRDGKIELCSLAETAAERIKDLKEKGKLDSMGVNRVRIKLVGYDINLENLEAAKKAVESFRSQLPGEVKEYVDVEFSLSYADITREDTWDNIKNREPSDAILWRHTVISKYPGSDREAVERSLAWAKTFSDMLKENLKAEGTLIIDEPLRNVSTREVYVKKAAQRAESDSGGILGSPDVLVKRTGSDITGRINLAGLEGADNAMGTEKFQQKNNGSPGPGSEEKLSARPEGCIKEAYEKIESLRRIRNGEKGFGPQVREEYLEGIRELKHLFDRLPAVSRDARMARDDIRFSMLKYLSTSNLTDELRKRVLAGETDEKTAQAFVRDTQDIYRGELTNWPEDLSAAALSADENRFVESGQITNDPSEFSNIDTFIKGFFSANAPKGIVIDFSVAGRHYERPGITAKELQSALREKADVVGLDLSLKEVRRSKEPNGPDYVQTDIKGIWPFKDGKADIIREGHTLQYLIRIDPAKAADAMNEAFRTLKEGGLFISAARKPSTLNEVYRKEDGKLVYLGYVDVNGRLVERVEDRILRITGYFDSDKNGVLEFPLKGTRKSNAEKAAGTSNAETITHSTGNAFSADKAINRESETLKNASRSAVPFVGPPPDWLLQLMAYLYGAGMGIRDAGNAANNVSPVPDGFNAAASSEQGGYVDDAGAEYEELPDPDNAVDPYALEEEDALILELQKRGVLKSKALELNKLESETKNNLLGITDSSGVDARKEAWLARLGVVKEINSILDAPVSKDSQSLQSEDLDGLPDEFNKHMERLRKDLDDPSSGGAQ
jgi:ubiquinone/menaquinone biosynthesis C-methylase UbiE